MVTAWVFVLLVAGALVGIFGEPAVAQQTATDDPVVEVAQTGGPSSTLVDSNTQVRRALIGLISVAVLTGLVGVAYWYFTGQQARSRFAAEHPGVEPTPLLGFLHTDKADPSGRHGGSGADASPSRPRPARSADPAPAPPAPAPAGRHVAPGEGLFDDPAPRRLRAAKPAASLWDGIDGQSRGGAHAGGRGWSARTPRHSRPLTPTADDNLFDRLFEPRSAVSFSAESNDDLFE